MDTFRMESRIWWLVTMTDKRELATELARGAVDEGLAACAQVEGPVTSIYKWQGQVQEEPEYRIVFKTRTAMHRQLKCWLEKNHPYEVPEIIGWPVPQALPAYADWVETS